ncbi:DnaJ subfamily C member 21-like 1 [Homarus americanus]|uniref:DnaJ subfamily C member 21-like 1 n=1 Tax=Homarus americanus TaxID=6706 RepID=A0A8J5MT02_HOMAM|nr:DnaJ subfamily C member 21-like 1 [Homarus americanus]
MTSHWQVLNITSDATPTEIREAYLRLARRCHPDKNPNDPEATKIFQRIQAAYVALNEVQCGQNTSQTCEEKKSQKSEKKNSEKCEEKKSQKWEEKKSHKCEEKKRSNQKTTSQCESRGTVNLWVHCSSESYSGPPDSDTGFHTVFRKLFQEISYWEMKSKGNTDNLPPPSFGGSNTTLKNVKKFYEYWTKFSTKMYVETNDAQDWLLIPDKTPSKHRLKSLQRDRKKFNMDIQYLVTLVKKQDQRLV